MAGTEDFCGKNTQSGLFLATACLTFSRPLIGYESGNSFMVSPSRTSRPAESAYCAAALRACEDEQGYSPPQQSTAEMVDVIANQHPVAHYRGRPSSERRRKSSCRAHDLLDCRFCLRAMASASPHTFSDKQQLGACFPSSSFQPILFPFHPRHRKTKLHQGISGKVPDESAATTSLSHVRSK